jgi:hypothetical protein
MIVPSTINRDNTEVNKSEEDSSGGKGIYDRAKRYKEVGARLRIAQHATDRFRR